MISLLHLLHSPANNQESRRALPERLRVLLLKDGMNFSVIVNMQLGTWPTISHLRKHKIQACDLKGQ